MNLTPFHGPPAVPPSVPGFVAHTLIGFGAHGEVWLAEDLSNGAQVALKVGHRAGPEPNVAPGPPPARLLSSVGLGPLAGGTAERETALLCRIDHPHIVRLQRVVQLDDNRLAMVLDLAAGGSLASLIAARGRFDPGEVSTLLIPLAGALEHLHRLGVVHGDISPGNVLFTGDGRPQLGDLGVARVLGSRAEEVWATPGFADPALTIGGSIDQQAADVWGLAAVAWFALTGGPPAVSSGSGGELAGLLAQCLAPDPTGRPGLAELADRAWQAARPVPVRLVGERPAISSEVGLPPISRQVTRKVVDRVPGSREPVAELTPRVRSAPGARRRPGFAKSGPGRNGLGEGGSGNAASGKDASGKNASGRVGSGRGRADKDGAGTAMPRPSGVLSRRGAVAVAGRFRGTARRHLAGAVTITVATVLLGALGLGLSGAVGFPGRAHRVEAVAVGSSLKPSGLAPSGGGPSGLGPSMGGGTADLAAELGQALVEIGRSRADAFATASTTGLMKADQEGSPAYLADAALIRRLQARGVRLQGVRYQVQQVRVLRRIGIAVKVAAVVSTSRHRQVATATRSSVPVPADRPQRMVFTVVPLVDGGLGPARWRVQSVRAA